VPLSPLAFRVLTVLAAGFLVLDGVALVAVGIWTGRPALLVAGAAVFLSSGLVLLLWRRHLRLLEEIDEVRRGLRDEAEELRRILRG
jgi:membrane protein implicated in regulation of membrane protease activity